MIFTKLELENFKSHKKTTIDFNSGISLIIGENGAGKSTIFEAISFALYKKYTGDKIDDLVRTNKDMENVPMSVQLSFISGGNEYRVTRGRRNRKSIARLERQSRSSFDFTPIVEGDSLVNKEIQDILEMDADLFLNAIYVRQGEIADLISKTPAERKQLIGKLLKLEELEKAWRNSPILISKYETRMAELKGKMHSQSELDYELKNLKQEEDELLSKAREEAGKRNILISRKEENDALKAEMETLKTSYENLKINLANEKSNLENLNKAKEELHKELSEITAMENQMNQLEKYSQMLPIYIDFKEAMDRLNDLKEQEKKQNQIIEDIKKFEGIIADEKQKFDEYISLEGIIKDLEAKKLSVESDIKILNNTAQEKSKLELEVSQSREALKKFSMDINDVFKDFELEEDFSSIESDEDFDKLKNTVDEIRIQARTDLDSNLERAKKLENESVSLQTEIKSTEKPLAEIKEVDNQCPVCKSDISPEKKEELISSYENTINSNTLRISELSEEMKKLDETNSLLKVKVRDLENIERSIYGNRHIAGSLSSNIAKIADLDKKLEDLNEKNQILADLTADIKTQGDKRKSLEANYNSYIQAQGALKTLPKEHEVKDELYKLAGRISLEEERIKKDISQDSYLSMDISSDDLNSKIEEFKIKDQRYNQLIGSVKRKDATIQKLDEKNKEIELKKAKIEEIQKNIDSSQYNEERYNEIKVLESRINEDISTNSAILGQVNGKLSQIKERIEHLKKALETNQKIKEEHDTLEKHISLLKEIRGLYGKDGIQGILRARSKPVIEKYTREFFEEFNFNYSNLILDNEYNITLYGPEGEAKLDMISGGEKIAVALALRLGITQAMSKGSIETILLDEPTIHLDSQRRQELIGLLRGMSVLPQMIIVTHDSELENAADSIIKVKKENGISKVEIE